MRIEAQALEAHLKRHFAPLYLITGDEPLQANEALTQVRAAARLHGFQDAEIFEVTAKFSSHDLLESLNSFNLFSNLRLIELRFIEAKLPKDMALLLQNHVQTLAETHCLIITLGKLDASTSKSAWFKACEQKRGLDPVCKPNSAQFPAWLKARFLKAGFSISSDALAALCYQTEGNLLAAIQAIEKLKLLHEAGPLDLAAIQAVLSVQTQYSVFDLVDSCLEGQYPRAYHILKNLEEDGLEPILVLWALSREARLLLAIQQHLDAGQTLAATLQARGIWPQRGLLIQKALAQVSIASLHTLLSQAHAIDCQIKGARPGLIWHDLLTLCKLLIIGKSNYDPVKI